MESEGIRLYGISDPFHLYHSAFLSQAEQNQDRAPLSKHKAMEPVSPCMAHRPHGASEGKPGPLRGWGYDGASGQDGPVLPQRPCSGGQSPEKL